MAVEILRMLRGNLTAREGARCTLLQVVVSSALFLLARLYYPPENHFSILTHTFSFLGSYERRHNPHGFAFFSAGLISWSLLFVPLLFYRHRRLAGVVRGPAIAGTTCFLIGCASLVGVALFPDVRQDFLQDLSYGRIHNKLALFVFLGFLAGMFCDGLVYAKDYVATRSGRSPTFRHRMAALILGALGAVVTLALVLRAFWEARYPVLHAQDPRVRHWPGPGIYSFPLWEWIIMVSFLAAFYALLLGLPGEVPKARDTSRSPHQAPATKP
jgi:hypothetical protein